MGEKKVALSLSHEMRSEDLISSPKTTDGLRGSCCGLQQSPLQIENLTFR